MRVKRIKSGKYSLEVSFHQRERIFSAICNFGEDESIELRRLEMLKEVDVMRHLYYNILENLLKRLNWQLHDAGSLKWTTTKAETIAIMWLLRNYDSDVQLLDLKSGLHKQLVG
jgi:hypothetical protein